MTAKAPPIVPVRRALVSLSDKSGLDTLARGLHERGVELLSTGGTARAIESLGIPVTRVESLTGVPEMLDGRVKTLHPAVHAGILADREKPEHMRTLDEHAFAPIDLVAVNLYPFERAVRDKPGDEIHAIENIDVGGPTMLRAAAKNLRGVTVITDASQHAELLAELDAHGGATTLAFRRRCAARGFALLAHYNAAIASTLSGHAEEETPSVPEVITLTRDDAHPPLRYGENPHQHAGVYRSPASGAGASLIGATQLAGKALSYNNLNDAAGALRAVTDLTRLDLGAAGACVVKHTNPCGLAISSDTPGAIANAIAGDPMAAFGGIVAINTPLDEDAARAIIEHAGFLEVVLAPSVDAGAGARLAAKWANLRVLAVGAVQPDAPEPPQLRTVPGGALAQAPDTRLDPPSGWTHTAGPTPTDNTLRVAALAWTAAKHLTSNAVALAAPDAEGNPMLVGGGAGQMDRVASCEIAVRKAGDRAKGAAAGSDAFFPFPDGPQVLIDAGVTTIVHPGGSKRDHETFDLCNTNGITCLTTGTRHFRH